MRNGKSAAQNRMFKPSDTWCYGWTTAVLEHEAPRTTKHYWSVSTTIDNQIQAITTPVDEIVQSVRDAEPRAGTASIAGEMTLADFVESRFVPEHVAKKRSAGRAYFHGILKHVLTPERVDRAFRIDEGSSRAKLRAISGWPYLDTVRLSDVDPDHVQRIIAAALERGYSTQTATHIRNVIRAIFVHAQRELSLPIANPASFVKMPDIVRKQAHALNMDQLRRLIAEMRSPEREIALLAVLTEMSVAEICGLQWKYVNLSEFRCMSDGEWISPRTIAVRKQSYRCEFGAVLNCRRRDIPTPDLLASLFRNIRSRKRFTGREDFVVVSRTGTPVNQDNVATRRLKAIGTRLEMPWLSWNVFHRTHVALYSELGRQLYSELEKVLPPELTLGRRTRTATTGQAMSAAD
jgi:integrase